MQRTGFIFQDFFKAPSGLSCLCLVRARILTVEIDKPMQAIKTIRRSAASVSPATDYRILFLLLIGTSVRDDKKFEQFI